MIKLIVFLVLLLTCWPLALIALIALILYPFIWLVLLPFRLLGIVITGIFDLIAALFYVPVRILRSI